MWAERSARYILKHRWQTVALVFAISFVPMIGVMGIVIAALVTLSRGGWQGALLTIAATASYVISFVVSAPGTTVPMVWVAALGVAILGNLLTWVFALLIRLRIRFNTILQVAALVGVFVISLIHLAYPHVADWWQHHLQAYYTATHKFTAEVQGGSAPSSETVADAIGNAKYYATGLMAAGIIVNAMLQMLIARWWQVLAFHGPSLRRELYSIRLSPLAGVLMVFSLVCDYLGNPVVMDMMPIAYVLFGAAGLSIFHYIFGLLKSSTGWMGIWVFYIAFIFSLPFSLVIVALLACLDAWWDVRKRIQKLI